MLHGNSRTLGTLSSVALTALHSFNHLLDQSVNYTNNMAV